jgi:hypothetical protein
LDQISWGGSLEGKRPLGVLGSLGGFRAVLQEALLRN